MRVPNRVDPQSFDVGEPQRKEFRAFGMCIPQKKKKLKINVDHARIDRKICKKSFSLIELLIVIAVMAILIAMLFPALRKAHNTAQRLTCIGNLKTIGQGVIFYAEDWNDWIYPNSGNPPYWTWYGPMLTYLGPKNFPTTAGTRAPGL